MMERMLNDFIEWKRYVLRIWVYSTVLKKMKPQLCFFLKTFSSYVCGQAQTVSTRTKTPLSLSLLICLQSWQLSCSHDCQAEGFLLSSYLHWLQSSGGPYLITHTFKMKGGES